MIFTAFTPAFASTNGTKDQPSLKTTDRNAYYTSIYSKLSRTFITTVHDESGDRAEIKYPADYAGAYIDASNNLHIIVVKSENTVATVNNYQKLLGDSEVIFETADFPLSHLDAVQSALNDVMLKFDIACTSLNETANKIDIHLRDNTKQKDVIEFLKTVFSGFDERCLAFKDDPVNISTTAVDSSTNALTGSSTTTITGGATIGFNAYRHATGQFGVVTAGHYATAGTTINNALAQPIGSETVRQYGGTVDAAFVPFGNNIDESYRISGFTGPNADCVTGWYNNLSIDSGYITGTSITKIGRTSGVNTGTVSSLNYSFTLDGTAFSQQVVLTNTQQGGDSGGPAFTTEMGPYPPNHIVYHILVGIATFQENGHALVSRVENIMNALGVSPYHYNP
jgi:hypothetical protein